MLPGKVGLEPTPTADPADVVAWNAGRLPKAGHWQHIEIDPTSLRIAVGAKVRGIAFLQKGGRIRWANLGIRTRTPQEGQRFESLLLWQTLEHQKTQENISIDHPKEVNKALKKLPEKRSPQQSRSVAERFFSTALDARARHLRATSQTKGRDRKRAPSVGRYNSPFADVR